MQVIPIFFASNDNYIPLVSVMIRSIMENTVNSEETLKYEIIILHRGISWEIIEKFREMSAEFPRFSINFHEMLFENSNFFISRNITVEAYFRLFIPFRFPQYEKALYFDGDMVCQSDVSELFNTDISNYLIASVRDVAVAWYFLPEKKKDSKHHKIYEYMLSMKKPYNYINSGMLLINCEMYRQTFSEKYISDTILSREWQIYDQDVINFLAEDKILYLDYKWDFMPLWEWAQYLPQNLKNEYIEAQKSPKIIHFKPHLHWWYVPYSPFFWKYAARTPFFKCIVDKMDKDGLLNEEPVSKMWAMVRVRMGWKAILKTLILERLPCFLRRP